MITGIVKETREAIVSLRLRGTNGLEIVVDGVLDTGFSESLALPEDLIVALSLVRIGLDEMILADGSRVVFPLYEGVVIWNSQERLVSIHSAEGSPLIGMGLLYDHLLTLQAVNGGQVTIERLRLP